MVVFLHPYNAFFDQSWILQPVAFQIDGNELIKSQKYI